MNNFDHLQAPPSTIGGTDFQRREREVDEDWRAFYAETAQYTCPTCGGEFRGSEMADHMAAHGREG
jgi:hypothetical protein